MQNREFNSKQFKKKYIEEILAFSSRSLAEWADDQLSQVGVFLKKTEKKNIKKSLDDIVVERKKLDIFLSLLGYSFNEQMRLYIFKRLCLLSREHFQEELNNRDSSFNNISDEQIILETFVKYSMQHNPFYQKVKVGQIILIKKGFHFGINRNDFIIKFKNQENIECQSGKMKLACLQGRWGVFYALTYFVWHMKKFHFDYFKMNKNKSELFSFLRTFDLNN